MNQLAFQYSPLCSLQSQMLLCSSRRWSIIPPLKCFQFGIPKPNLTPYAECWVLLKNHDSLRTGIYPLNKSVGYFL